MTNGATGSIPVAPDSRRSGSSQVAVSTQAICRHRGLLLRACSVAVLYIARKTLALTCYDSVLCTDRLLVMTAAALAACDLWGGSERLLRLLTGPTVLLLFLTFNGQICHLRPEMTANSCCRSRRTGRAGRGSRGGWTGGDRCDLSPFKTTFFNFGLRY